jgi:NAD(P)-dependent dehydrogenase (short-subunit alcohol dehydrogenase family)
LSSGVISTPGSAEFAKTTPEFLLMIGFGIFRLVAWATEDIAEVVALLASVRGTLITGANYRVDGGMTAR